jgi:hypothetical protein
MSILVALPLVIVKTISLLRLLLLLHYLLFPEVHNWRMYVQLISSGQMLIKCVRATATLLFYSIQDWFQWSELH